MEIKKFILSQALHK